MEHPGVESVVAFPGLSINGFVTSSSAAVFFAMLDPFEQRTTAELSAGAIAGGINAKLGVIEEGFVAMFPPPPVPGLGATGGFKLQIQDRQGRGYQALAESVQAVMKEAGADPRLTQLFSAYQVNVPQLSADVDRLKAKALGIDLSALYETLQIHLGSLYVNDFNYLGRTYQVNVQANAKYRADADAVSRLWTRNLQGELAPVSSVVKLRPDAGPDPVTRYNGFPSADLGGAPGAGASSGDAVEAMRAVLDRTLKDGFQYEWTDLTYQQIREGQGGLLVFPLAVLFAFLVLAAQYNSWKLPLAVLLIAPMALLSALAGVWLTGGDINLFTQIAFVVLVGLATKNAILIVEFALRLETEGRDALSAVLEACRLRLRPILMTSLAFVMGVVPLAFATGAGSEMRRAMGVAVLSGMAGVTLFGLALTPVFYMLLRRRAQRSVAKEMQHA
jgi:gold/copper resistance efflux pump